ncbi:DUF1800 domain-containing protein [Parasediminibacterium sp. JCM 36343]|uniref:DUF1800 domain-containing protein n=1 Tax=Parasediminibacterium sp. JCM 36343 TaxID=3374279 RepID=UPI00397AD622
MKTYSKVFLPLLVLIAAIGIFSSYTTSEQSMNSAKFPYKKAGLTDKQAAAHLLSRFTFGATPGQVDEVAKIGVEKWFEQQLEASQPDDSLSAMLNPYETLSMDNTQIVNIYPQNNNVTLKMAIKDGYIKSDSGQFDKKEYRPLLEAYMKEKGLKPSGELFRQLINQKILRAAYSNNQLKEVMTSFWFNHFNVSLTKNECGHYITVYEKDVLRPNALGNFGTLLLATAKSPAMLAYLDNFRSVASEGNGNTEAGAKRLRELYAQQLMMNQTGDTTGRYKEIMDKIKKAKNAQGLNENYAREVMELHTLGVDGGYTQTDVTNAAKVLTGWTIYPMHDYYGGQQAIKKMIEKVGEEKLKQQGFVHDGDFMFTVNKHDKTEKVVLGKTFPAGGGYDEGVKLLDILAHHTSTAHFISKKLAVRFVSDNPPQALIDRMAKTFLDKDGNIKEVLMTMVKSPEFWAADALRDKIKSPFELTISTVRALNAKVTQPYQLFNWINKMGEKIYYYQAPTGFPDKAQYWINTGSLLSRMNFGLAMASQRIPGVTFSLVGLNNNHEPESAEAALATYCKLLMPERKVDETVKRLQPLINDPQLHKKIDSAASKAMSMAPPQEPQSMTMNSGDDMMMSNGDGEGTAHDKKRLLKEKPGKKKVPDYTIQQLMAMNAGNNTMLSQVTGIIIGSPEFQRR